MAQTRGQIDDRRNGAHISTTILQDPGTGIDEPGFVCRYLVQQAIKQFRFLSGRAPIRVYIPKAVEVVLQVDAARNLDQHNKLRDELELFGLQVVWDAQAFKIE